MPTPLVSLCIIVGNVEDCIERCLTSFAPIADEIVVVRAVGALPPDETLSIARRFGALVGEYHNAPGKDDWLHVDDFAAARQMSFDLASGRYCFWCDSDDELVSGAEHVREHAERYEYAAHVFPYLIQNQGVKVPRERLVLRRIGRWKYPVHECYQFPIDPVAGCEDERIVVAHRPSSSKTGSNERNLRILQSIPNAEMNAGLLYHLHGELLGIGDIPGSIKAAEAALETGQSGKDERYEMMLNLATAAKNPGTRGHLLHAAYEVDPGRREALGVLAGHAMDHGLGQLGLIYALQMYATPVPRVRAWNQRDSFYGWIGHDILEQAYRCAGDPAKAERFRQGRMARNGGARISLVHATRGRPEMAVRTRKAWLDMADDPERVEHIFAFDQDDQQSHPLARFHHVSVPQKTFAAGGGCVAAWNHGAMLTTGRVIVALSDDWRPIPGWDSAIVDRIGDANQCAVLAVSDGFRQDRMLCMAILTRALLVREGFIFHPSFSGVYSDNWFTDCAYARGEVIEARDLVFEHQHPLKTGGHFDETYARQNSVENYRKGLATLQWLESGRDWSSVPGFFDYWIFYTEIAGQLPHGAQVVEVGVWLGRSIIYMAQECKRLGKTVSIHAVDTFVGEVGQQAHAGVVALHGGNLRNAFEANLKRCEVWDQISVMESKSVDAAALFQDGSLDFVFIDAAHDYDSVKEDIEAWSPKIKPGGTLAGHDAQDANVEKAVRETLPGFRRLGFVWWKTYE